MRKKDVPPGAKTLKLLIPIKYHSDLKIRCFYDRISMTKLVRELIKGYINNDIRIVEFVNDFKDQNKIVTKNRNRANVKDVIEGKKRYEEEFLSNEDIENIYDALEIEYEEF